MRAVVLAAGEGTRLRPLTADRPKCLVELGGRSLLERQIAVLRAAGISDITVVGGYRADQLRGQTWQVVRNEDYATTNMVATLFCARDTWSSDTDLVVCYGDIVYEQRVLRTLLASRAPIGDPVAPGRSRSARRRALRRLDFGGIGSEVDVNQSRTRHPATR